MTEYEAVDITLPADATPVWTVIVREPGMEWVLGGRMYEWQAKQLAEHLNATQPAWRHP